MERLIDMPEKREDKEVQLFKFEGFESKVFKLQCLLDSDEELAGCDGCYFKYAHTTQPCTKCMYDEVFVEVKE